MVKQDLPAAFPYFSVVYILLIAFAAYLLISQITSLLVYGCGRHRPGLVLERFSSDGDSAKRYFDSSSKTIEAYNTRLTAVNAAIAAARDLYDGMHNDICSVMTQVDDGLTGNYVGNVPEEEYRLPAEQQASRKAKRQAGAAAHLADLKKRFSAGYDNAPLVECFDAISPDEQESLEGLRTGILSGLNELESSMGAAEKAFATLRADVDDRQLATYYTSLAFTDKNITNMLKVQASATEGFDDGGPVLTFTPPKPPVSDPTAEPHVRLPKIAERLAVLERDVKNLVSGLQIMANTIALQNKTLKKSKRIINDTDEQKRRLDAQAAKISATTT
jgi:hypothetical protein